jgi:hypothetical protein
MAVMASEFAAGDRAAVVRAALDYFEGWFDGDAARVERALHPELARRRSAPARHDRERDRTCPVASC